VNEGISLELNLKNLNSSIQFLFLKYILSETGKKTIIIITTSANKLNQKFVKSGKKIFLMSVKKIKASVNVSQSPFLIKNLLT
tara:strand:+ start:166 stop:414 length:249 start_codon:yes stop_codon:yes gene_type:complete